jgi:branched-chain amino acid transport system permease protein
MTAACCRLRRQREPGVRHHLRARRGLAGFGGVIGAVELSMVPGEDTRLLLASLIVVIVGGMGSVLGAAVGAAILGLAETYGLAYAPTYSVVFTFLILIGVLAFRPRGIMGRPA